MPIYEYQCGKCETSFELLIRSSEQPACPDCGTHDVDKRLSVPAAHRASFDLPICQPRHVDGCGLPQCGGGGCQLE